MNEKQTSTPEDHREAATLYETPPPTDSAVQEKIRRNKIRTLNDLLRTTFIGGKVVMTQGIASMTALQQYEITKKVQTFSDFSKDNDPHGEHDYGSFDFEQNRIAWKIDYYDQNVHYGSEDPTNPEVTTRVLTIMLTSEY